MDSHYDDETVSRPFFFHYRIPIPRKTSYWISNRGISGNRIDLILILLGYSGLRISFLDQFMVTSSNGNIFRVTGLSAGNTPVSGEFPIQRPVTRSFDVFFDMHLIKRLSKHSRGWWFETLPRQLWRHCNVSVNPPTNPKRQFPAARWEKSLVKQIYEICYLIGENFRTYIIYWKVLYISFVAYTRLFYLMPLTALNDVYPSSTRSYWPFKTPNFRSHR